MIRFGTLILLASVAVTANAQSFSEYLRMRQRNSITRPSNVASLDSLLGSKVMELRGVVKGSFRVGTGVSLLADLGDGKSQVVETVSVPDWLLGNETPARLLVRAIRPEANSPLRVVLIGAAQEAAVDRVDTERARKVAARAAADKAAAEAAAARRAAVPVTPQGAPLVGTIGRGGSRLTASSRTWNVPTSQITPYYAAFIRKVNSKLSDESALRVAKAVVGFSIHYRVDPRLVMAILMVESGFDPNSVSRSGAVGLGQLMPATARWMGVTNPYDTTDNLYGSIKLLRTHLNKYERITGEKFESLVLTLAAYNAGEGAVRRHGGVPPYRETQRYVRKVLSLYAQISGAQ